MIDNGVKNNNNIIAVLKTIRVLPYLLFSVLLKYSETRTFSVLEKSELTDLEKVKFLIGKEIS